MFELCVSVLVPSAGVWAGQTQLGRGVGVGGGSEGE